MPETAENVARQFGIERDAQDRMALASQLKAVAAQRSGVFDAEITPVSIAQRKGDPVVEGQGVGGIRRHTVTGPGLLTSAGDLRPTTWPLIRL